MGERLGCSQSCRVADEHLVVRLDCSGVCGAQGRRPRIPKRVTSANAYGFSSKVEMRTVKPGVLHRYRGARVPALRCPKKSYCYLLHTAASTLSRAGTGCSACQVLVHEQGRAMAYAGYHEAR